jgi:hypothetical protein
MSGESQGVQITEHDVEAASAHFEEWIKTLPEQDRNVFGWILTRAASAKEQDAVNYGMGAGADVPLPQLVADAAGVGAAAAGDVRGFALPDKIGPVKVWTYRW